MKRAVTALPVVAALVLGCLYGAGAAADQAPTTQWGYITTPDGTHLRYTVELPAPGGRHPVAMTYDGYCEGTGATGCNDPDLSSRLLRAGYAVLGVSVRGTGCSSGTFDFRAHEESTDGSFAVAWASRQKWSSGRVGLFGDSFPGLTQPGIAALRPKGLAAIAPFQVVDDVYGDVAYPGGIVNDEFGAFWGLGDQPSSEAVNPVAASQQGDTGCALSYGEHLAPSATANIYLNARQHPWYDGYWQAKEVGAAATRIDVPTLGCLTWQDDEVGSRPGWSLFRRVNPAKLWMIASNGEHGLCDRSEDDRLNAQVVRFFDRFVKGRPNGWEHTPRVQVWHETSGTGSFNAARWITTFSAWPPRTSARRLYLGGAGDLSAQPSVGSGTAGTYRAPWPSAGTEEGVVLGQSNRLWQRPVPPGGALAWTTPRLAKDVEVLGPASADIWLSSTGTDTDLQVTVTEVRPDGQETYVARGWLRASHRAVDGANSTSTRPQHSHREASAEPLSPGVPALLRVEIFPFDHVFRAGSSIRLVLDTPSQTGGWNFGVLAAPVSNTVLDDPRHRSQLVLGVLPGGRALRPLPACGVVRNQPCRSNAYPVPEGRLDWPGF